MDKSIMEARVVQWMPILEAQARSGMSKDKWCDEHGIRRWEFYARQRQIRQYLSERKAGDMQVIQELPAAESSFVEIPITCTKETSLTPLSSALSSSPTVSPSPEKEKTGRIDISYRGFNINLHGCVDDTTLESLIRTISHV